ncbi:MAG: hypothetical protein ABSD49_13470 [Candidatus Bathyarchaeia archaeon]|jgi:hypothetical protein
MVTCPICKSAKLLPFIKSAVAGEYPPKLTAGIETVYVSGVVTKFVLTNFRSKSIMMRPRARMTI